MFMEASSLALQILMSNKWKLLAIHENHYWFSQLKKIIITIQSIPDIYLDIMDRATYNSKPYFRLAVWKKYERYLSF